MKIYKVKVKEKKTVTVTETHSFLWWTWTTTKTKTITITKVKYSYTKPFIGKNGNSVIPNLFTAHPIVSTVHTHANYDPKYDNENFSTGTFSDIWWSNLFCKDSYVATPGGSLKKYTYANKENSTGGVDTISTDIPWDTNSPFQ